MKATIGTALIAATVLLTGCNKDVYEDSPAPPPAAPADIAGDNADDPNMQDGQTNDVAAPKSKPAKPLTDNFIKRKIVGVWKPDPDDAANSDLESLTVTSNGTLTVIFNPDNKDSKPNKGTWKVKKGYFIVSQKDDDGSMNVASNKVIRLTDDEWSFTEEDDTAEPTTLHKQ